jgi:chemotaxis methyl-accepting protein methylase
MEIRMAKRAAEAAPQLVLRASRSCRFPDESGSQTAELTRALDSIVALVHRQAGIELRGYKPAPVLNRIQQRMSLRRIRSLGDYESLLHGDPAELESLVRGIPIHVTGFFRDPAAWHVLNNEVIGPLAADCGPGEHIRIWTPACASGEEAYSIAMLLSEYLDTAGHAPDFQLFATDASAEIVARANRGAFPARALSSMSASRRARFFHEVDGGYHVDRGLREKMVFATQNLLVDPPFTHLDLVTCRNLLIYLDPEAVQRALYRLHSSLRAGGYLFLGPAEGFSFRQPEFEVVSSDSRIYRKDGPFSDVPFRVAAPSKRERDETRARSRPDRAVSGSFGDDNVERSAREWSGALRTSQEELAASRMELQALNEELNASREKLNAAHEELSRAALQLEDKTAELEMQSRVLSTGEVTTLFLDLELRVRCLPRPCATSFRCGIQMPDGVSQTSSSDSKIRLSLPISSRSCSRVSRTIERSSTTNTAASCFECGPMCRKAGLEVWRLPSRTCPAADRQGIHESCIGKSAEVLRPSP